MSNMNKASLKRALVRHRILSDDDWPGLPTGALAEVSGKVSAMWRHLIILRCHDGSLLSISIEGDNRLLLVKGAAVERLPVSITAVGLVVAAEELTCRC